MAVNVTSRAASQLSPAEQRAAYEEEGYLVFPELLDAMELGTLRTALEDVLRESEGLTGTNDKFSITRTDDDGYSVRRIFDPIARHDAFRDLVLKAPAPSLAEAPVQLLLMNAAIDLMPAFARDMHGLTRPMLPPVVRAATFGIAGTIRWAFAGEQYRKAN